MCKRACVGGVGPASQAAAGFKGRSAALGETPVPTIKSSKKRGSSIVVSCPPPPAPRFAVLCLRLLFLKGSYGSGEVLLPLWKGASEEADVPPFVGVLMFTKLRLIFWSMSLGAYVL